MAPDVGPGGAAGPGAPGVRRRVRRATASVRFRVTALATLALFGVLALTAIVLVAAQRRALTNALDDAMNRRSDDVVALAEAVSLGAELPGRGGDDDLVAQVVADDGEVVSASPVLVGEPAQAPPLAPGRERALSTVDGLPFEDDDPFRLLSRRVTGADGAPLTVHVAGNRDDVDEAVEALAASATLVVPLAAAVLAALVWWLVGRTLRPVEAMRAEVADIRGSDLHRRVPVPPTDDEVARLARTMNGMLDRVEDAVGRQQRFVADASHELRSPLARIRAEVEVDLAHPEAADPTATHRSVLAEATGLQALVSDLLYLARSDAGAAVAARAPVDLDDVVLECARRLRTTDGVRVDTSGVAAAQVLGSADQLARAVGNLADNAARHARKSVAFTVREDGEWAEVAVTDDGPGIPAEERERVFDRFTRLDPAREESTGGAGLGLAIARDVVQRHGGTIVVDPDHPAGARVVVTLPLAPAGG